MSSKVVTVNCAIRCGEDGEAPSEAVVSEMLKNIELYAVRNGYKGIIEDRQYWGPASGVAGVTTPPFGVDFWVFALYRDYNAP